VVKDFNREPRSVRPDHPLLPVNNVEYKDTSYSYFLPRRFVRLAHEGDSFRIDKREVKSRFLSLRLLSKRGAKVSLGVYAKDPLTQDFVDHVVPLMLSDLFLFGEAPQGQRFIGNSESGFLHLATCNHLPDPEHRLGFATREQGESAGYKRCAVCFAAEEAVPIEGYNLVRATAIERARIYELAFPPLEDAAVQAGIQSLGDSLVDNFPVEPRGFAYSFKVVHSQFANAVSFPTGFVFISDKLFQSVEDRAELKFVLAHEIAHVELGRFEIERPIDPSPALPGSFWDTLRFRETEADILAIVTLWQTDARPQALQRASNALRKMEFESESTPQEKEDRYATHPSFAARYRYFDAEHFVRSQTPAVFCGQDDRGETVARVQMVAQSVGRTPGFGENPSSMRTGTVYLLLHTTDLVNGRVRITGGKIVDGAGKTFDLSRLGASLEESGPDDTTVMALKLSNNMGDVPSDGPVREIRLSGMDVKKWVVCSD
jgi:hypothetical protein